MADAKPLTESEIKEIDGYEHLWDVYFESGDFARLQVLVEHGPVGTWAPLTEGAWNDDVQKASRALQRLVLNIHRTARAQAFEEAMEALRVATDAGDLGALMGGRAVRIVARAKEVPHGT